MATNLLDTDVQLSKGLWALHLTANRRKHVQPLLPIHITNAALPQTLSNPTGRSVVKLTSAGTSEGSILDGFILVSLVGGRVEQAPLDFYLEGEQSYAIEVIGDNDIFLAGNFITTASVSKVSQSVERTTNSQSTNQVFPRTKPVQRTLEAHLSTSTIASACSETSNATAAPIKANMTGLDKIDFSKLSFIDITRGAGDMVELENRVSVYFDIVNVQKETYIAQWSHEDGPPFVFEVGSRSVIEGFNKGIIGMREGGVREIYVPYKLAYGEKALSKVPARSDVVIRCTLCKVDSDI